jgi:hypothetical protein
MSVQESNEETYKRIKKRLGDYRYRSAFLSWGTLAFVVLFIFSLVPIVPAIIIGSLGLLNTDWVLVSWFLCAVVFGGLFWIFQKFAGIIQAKRGILLEERMYVYAYEALHFLKEYSVPNHPVLSGKSNAIRQLRNIDYLLESTRFPYVSIIGDEVGQVWLLRENLKHRLRPSIKNLQLNDAKGMQATFSAVTELVGYLSKPTLSGLVALNRTMVSLPTVTKKGILEDFMSVILRRSNLRHVAVLSIFAAFAWVVSYVDLNQLGATSSAAFEFGLMFLLTIAAIYVAYLALSVRKEQRT